MLLLPAAVDRTAVVVVIDDDCVYVRFSRLAASEQLTFKVTLLTAANGNKLQPERRVTVFISFPGASATTAVKLSLPNFCRR